jgi:hypothetical protein
MELKQEHITRALEVFTTYANLQKEINENQEKLNQLSNVQQQLIKRLDDTRISEQEWITELSKEYNTDPVELTKEIGSIVLSEVSKIKNNS